LRFYFKKNSSCATVTGVTSSIYYSAKKCIFARFSIVLLSKGILTINSKLFSPIESGIKS
jgi:hypothetical protein